MWFLGSFQPINKKGMTFNSPELHALHFIIIVKIDSKRVSGPLAPDLE